MQVCFRRYNEDYDQAGRRSKMEDTRITPGFKILAVIFVICFLGNYSYMSLRARTPSVERNTDTVNKQLRFPRHHTLNLLLFFDS